MSFTDDQKAALSAPLAREHVKSRDQGRGKVSYIEGWHAIAEMNRIFGFDGWTRETVMSECCHEGPYQKAVYENGQRTNRTVESFRCSYRARVRVTVGDVVREGSGHGHGFADNPGEAHESAEKEAETDAMKRALMTFGNPLGLALYDKTQAEVEPMPQRGAQRPTDTRSAPPPQSPPRTGNGHQAPAAAALPPHPEESPEASAQRQRVKALIDELQAGIRAAKNSVALDAYWASQNTKTTLAIIEQAGAAGKEAAYKLRSKYLAMGDQLKDEEAMA